MVATLFNILFFLIPLIFWKNTSEVFEFNKIITVYLATTLITTAWIIKSISQRKIIFRRTILDTPLLVYLSVYLLSTLFSFDPRTSWLGYYSRFNGGFLSQVCYALLYWAFVSNMDKPGALKTLKWAFIGLTVASIIGFFEHFGVFPTCPIITYDRLNLPANTQVAQDYNNFSFIQKTEFLFKTSCWEQDLKNRVFSTFGQPNWLAAAIVVFLPLTWIYLLKSSLSKDGFLKKKILSTLLSVFLFSILLFTKSRSGILAFGLEAIVFWVIIYLKTRVSFLKEFLLLNSLFLILFLIIQSPFRPQPLLSPGSTAFPALEGGGTESGSIRKIVWKGAWEIFKHYPLLGTGPETFAFSYPAFKPIEHNLTSEWDFIYNKAHNDYLNYLATTGILGFGSYVFLVLTTVVLIFKNIRQIQDNSDQYQHSKKVSLFAEHDWGWKLQTALLSGYISILVTNFFGFAVVAISLLFFLIPAFSTTIMNSKNLHFNKTRLKSIQWLAVLTVLGIGIAILYRIVLYFTADTYYNTSKLQYREGNYQEAEKNIQKALLISSHEPLYSNQLAIIKAQTAQNKEDATQALDWAEKAATLSPNNINLKRSYAVLLARLSQYDNGYLTHAVQVLQNATTLAPTDAKLYYQLGLSYLRIGQNDLGVSALQKSIELKPNYKEGRFALGVTFQQLKENEKAKEQFSYILQNIDPNDELTKKYLSELN